MKTYSTEKNGFIRKVAYTAVSAAFWLGLWLFAAYRTGTSLLLPGPGETAAGLLQLIKTPDFWLICAKSLLRVVIGTSAGIILGVLFAVLCSLSELISYIVSPLVRIIKTTPVASFIILAMLWLGRGVLPSFIAALMVLPPVFQNVLTGIEEIPAGHRKLITVFKPAFFTKITKIYIPDVMPYFTAALTTSAGLAWKAGIAAEVLAFSPDSIGRQLSESKNLLETTQLFAWTAAVIIISLIIELVFRLLFIRLTPKKAVSEERVHVKA